MKKAIILVGCILFLVACKSEAATQREDETITLYNKNCAGCHGLQLQGTQLGSEIRGLKKKDILNSIQNGEENMPANILTGENADRVATWVSKQR